MSSLFTKIVRGEIPSHKVWEDDAHLAFLDINPIATGHTLVIPKREVDYLFDVDEAAYLALWNAARAVAARLKEALGCARVCVAVQGYEIPHAHIHLIPTNHVSEFPAPAGRPTDQAELADLAAKLRG